LSVASCSRFILVNWIAKDRSCERVKEGLIKRVRNG
jgi:hypothetical protein